MARQTDMSGIYEWFFGPSPPPTSVNPERHWQREESDYLTKIGAMALINRDPYAALGLKARAHPDYLTLNMGGTPSYDAYGDYIFHRAFTEPPPGTLKRSGQMNVAVGQSPTHYGATLAHELGHVGRRNMVSEQQASVDIRSGADELQQSLADFIINPPNSREKGFGESRLKEAGLTPREIGRRASILTKTRGLTPWGSNR
jgi:hypothetical protein